MQYNTTMPYLQRFLYQSTGVLFKLLLLLLPIIFAVTMVFGSPHTVEKALKESRIYTEFVGLVLTESQKNTQDPQAKQLLETREIQNAAQTAFPPDVLEKSATSFIDGVYAWLAGQTDVPQFSIDLTESKDALVEGVAAYAVARTNQLPACTLQQLQTLNLETDLLSLPCLPPGVSSAQVGQQFSQQLLKDADFLQDPVITHESLKTADGKQFGQDLQQIPAAYQAAQTAQWILLVVTIVLAGTLIFLRRDRVAGVRHVAWALVATSTFLIIALIGYWFFFGQVNKSGIETDPMQAILFDGAQVITRELNTIIMWFVAGYLVLAGAMFGWIKTRPKNIGTAPQMPNDAETRPIIQEQDPTKPTTLT